MLRVYIIDISRGVLIKRARRLYLCTVYTVSRDDQLEIERDVERHIFYPFVGRQWPFAA